MLKAQRNIAREEYRVGWGGGQTSTSAARGVFPNGHAPRTDLQLSPSPPPLAASRSRCSCTRRRRACQQSRPEGAEVVYRAIDSKDTGRFSPPKTETRIVGDANSRDGAGAPVGVKTSKAWPA